LADLSTLDATQPPDTQLVALGAQRIRETRDATKTSFALEHALTGEHRIPIGGTGGEPAAGHAGRLYINTSADTLEYDTGSAWVGILGQGSGIKSVRDDGPFTVPNGSFLTLLNLSPFALATSANVYLIAKFAITYGTTILGMRFLVDGSPLATDIKTGLTGGAGDVVTMQDMSFPVSSGSHSFSIQAEGSGGTHTVTKVRLLVIPIY
jgi:hypothetical protein